MMLVEQFIKKITKRTLEYLDDLDAVLAYLLLLPQGLDLLQTALQLPKLRAEPHLKGRHTTWTFLKIPVGSHLHVPHTKEEIIFCPIHIIQYILLYYIISISHLHTWNCNSRHQLLKMGPQQLIFTTCLDNVFPI